MYTIHACPDGRPLADISAQSTSASGADTQGLVLHLQENRSDLSQEARLTFTVLIALFMAGAILPAIKGNMLVPIYALGTMALLVGAIEWHKRSRPAAEWLTIEGNRLRWASDCHEPVDLPVSAARLVQDDAAPARLRLFLESHWQRIEIGRCLSLNEKREVAPLIARHLREAHA
ncbi:MAG: DUF2244 domain-containing protein [Sphingomonadaceae bacterium]